MCEIKWVALLLVTTSPLKISKGFQAWTRYLPPCLFAKPWFSINSYQHPRQPWNTYQTRRKPFRLRKFTDIALAVVALDVLEKGNMFSTLSQTEGEGRTASHHGVVCQDDVVSWPGGMTGIFQQYLHGPLKPTLELHRSTRSPFHRPRNTVEALKGLCGV